MPNKISLFLNPISILDCDFALAFILIKLAFLPLLHLEIPNWLCHIVKCSNSVGLNSFRGINQHFLHFPPYDILICKTCHEIYTRVDICVCALTLTHAHTHEPKLKKEQESHAWFSLLLIRLLHLG